MRIIFGFFIGVLIASVSMVIGGILARRRNTEVPTHMQIFSEMLHALGVTADWRRLPEGNGTSVRFSAGDNRHTLHFEFNQAGKTDAFAVSCDD